MNINITWLKYVLKLLGQARTSDETKSFDIYQQYSITQLEWSQSDVILRRCLHKTHIQLDFMRQISFYIALKHSRLAAVFLYTTCC